MMNTLLPPLHPFKLRLNKMHKDHPFLSDMVEGGLAAGATIATGGLAEAGLGAVAGEEMLEGGVTGIASRALDSAASRATGAVDRLAAGASRPAIEDGALPGLQQSLVNRGAAYVKSGIEKWKGEAAKQLGVEGVTTGLKDEIDQEEADEAATEAAKESNDQEFAAQIARHDRAQLGGPRQTALNKTGASIKAMLRNIKACWAFLQRHGIVDHDVRIHMH